MGFLANAVIAGAAIGWGAASAWAGSCVGPDATGLVACTYDGDSGTTPGAYPVTIPPHVGSVDVDAFGARGGNGKEMATPGGAGAEVKATLGVPDPTSGEVLTLVVAETQGPKEELHYRGGFGYVRGGKGGDAQFGGHTGAAVAGRAPWLPARRSSLRPAVAERPTTRRAEARGRPGRAAKQRRESAVLRAARLVAAEGVVAPLASRPNHAVLSPTAV